MAHVDFNDPANRSSVAQTSILRSGVLFVLSGGITDAGSTRDNGGKHELLLNQTVIITLLGSGIRKATLDIRRLADNIVASLVTHDGTVVDQRTLMRTDRIVLQGDDGAYIEIKCGTEAYLAEIDVV